MRESDVVARMGGDEFLVLMPKLEKDEDINLVAEKIRFVLNHPFIISGNSIDISASIGIAIYPKDGHDERTLTRKADSAMYNAKQKGRNRVSSFLSDDS